MHCAKSKLVTLVAILGLFLLTGCIFNRPPLKPANPQPQFDAQNIPLNTILSWNCSDPDGDQLTYKVYFGTDPNSLQEKSHQTSTSYAVNSLDPSTKYYWRIEAVDQYGNYCVGDLWMFTTEEEKNSSPTLNIPNQNVYKGMFSLNLLNYATDSNGDKLSFTLVSGVGSIDGNKYTYSFAKSGQYTVKIRVSDGASVAESEFVITVINRAPTINIPDQTVVKGQTLQVSLTQYATDPDGDGLTCQKMKGVGNVNENIFTLSTDDLSIGNYDVKMQVSDGESVAEDVFTITVTESEVDLLTLDLPDQIVEEGQTLQLDLSQYAKDKKGDVLSFVLISGVGNISGHIFTYSPDYLSAGQYQVKVRTSDGNLFAEDEFNITVNNKPRAPIFDIGDMSINENEPLQIGLSQYASDPDGDTLTFTLVSGIGSVSGNVYSYYPDYTSAGDYKVTIRVSDGSFFTDDSFTITVNNVSRPPQINIPDMVIGVNKTLTFDLTQYASDPDGDTLYFTLVSGGGNINGNTFTFSFTSWPSVTNNVTIRVSDGVLSAEDSFKITDLPHLPPSFRFNDIPGQNIDEGQTLQLDLTQYAYDSSGKPLTFTVVSGIGNINGNIYTYAADYSSAGQYTVTLRVSNGQTSLDKTFSLTVNNKNRAPQFIIPDQTTNEGSSLNLDLSQYASDPDGDTLAFTLVSGVGSVSGKIYSYTPDYVSVGQHQVSIGVSDGQSTTNDTFLITVNNKNRPPQISIPDQTIEEGQVLTIDLTDYASDPDEDPLTFTLVSGSGTIRGNTYQYSADYGSAGLKTIKIRVNDGSTSAEDTFSLTILEAISNVTISVNPFPYGEEIVNTIYTNIWAKIYYTTGDGTYEYYDTCQCDDNGIMSLQNVPFGEYSAGFYYDSSIQDLETGSTIEYWGEKDFSVDSATVNVDFERNAPYLLDMYPWYGERIRLSEQPTATFYNGIFYDAEVIIEFYFSQRSNHSKLYYAEQGKYLNCYIDGSALFYVFGGPAMESCYFGNDATPDFMIIVRMKYTNPDGTKTSVVTNKIPWIPTYVTP